MCLCACPCVSLSLPLHASDRLDYDLMCEVFKAGYSRVPVFHDTEDRVLGFLYLKDLVLITPAVSVCVLVMVWIRVSVCVCVCSDADARDLPGEILQPRQGQPCV